MKLINKNIFFWDFDGVLMDSNSIRNQGFIEVLKQYPDNEVNQLLEFHKNNGGLSRYVKFRHFFEEIRKETLDEKNISNLAISFSEIMRNLLIKPNLLIGETLNFIKIYYQKYPMHIVSGSDGNELRYLCEQLNISKYFVSINGSPTPKNELVAYIISNYDYNPNDCLLIGDSINDHEAAVSNNIAFEAYNNDALTPLNSNKTVIFTK